MFSKRQFLTGAGALAFMPGAALAAAPLEVPILPTASGLPAVDVMIAGKGPYRFIVASGASSWCIRRGLGRELGLTNKSGLLDKLFGPTTASIGNDETTAKYPCDSLSIGGVTLPPVVLEGFDVAEGADGLLGTGFFAWRSVELDMAAGVLRIYDDGGPDLSGFAKVPSRRKGSVSSDPPYIITTAGFDGIAVECMVNTSSAADIYLTSKYVRKHGLWQRYAAFEDHQVSGGSAIVTSRRGQLDKVTIGALSFDDVTLFLGNPDHDDNLGDIIGGAGGAIGMSLLQRCDLFIPRDEGLYLKPV